MPKRHEFTHVYVADLGLGRVKIGISTNPEGRMRSLGATLVHAFEHCDPAEVEMLCSDAWHSRKVHGRETFAASPLAAVRHVRKMMRAYDDGLRFGGVHMRQYMLKKRNRHDRVRMSARDRRRMDLASLDEARRRADRDMEKAERHLRHLTIALEASKALGDEWTMREIAEKHKLHVNTLRKRFGSYQPAGARTARTGLGTAARIELGTLTTGSFLGVCHVWRGMR